MNKLTRYQDDKTTVGITCPVCRTRRAKSLYSYDYGHNKSDIVQCVTCKHISIYPVPLVELNERNMDTVDDAEFYGNKIFKWLHKRFVINREIRNVQKLLNATDPKLLDIGCGTGWTTAIWKNNGFFVTGIEPSPTRSAICKERYNIEVFTGHIEEFRANQKFDVIIMRHLLEHIENPSSVLEKVRTLIADNGILIVVAPNINSIGRFLFKENWEWVLPWHVHFYKPKTLTQICENAGFKKLKLYQTPSPLWYPNSAKKALGSTGRIAKFFGRAPNMISIIPFIPLILIGSLFNLNDNLVLFTSPDKK